MHNMQKIKVMPLGQSGFRFDWDGVVIYIDPYLSESVADFEGEHLQRILPPLVKPQDIVDADWVLITHIHPDHCDPLTIGPLAKSSLNCQFVGPNEVIRYLETEVGIDISRLHVAHEKWLSLCSEIKLNAIPSAHRRIERDADGCLRYLGYVIDFSGKRIYHSGDCSVHPDIVQILRDLAPIEVAFLPVNECNYYRDLQGIIGNMSIREAFNLAIEIGVKKVVPMHYDVFKQNCVYTEEISVVYEKIHPEFELLFQPREV